MVLPNIDYAALERRLAAQQAAKAAAAAPAIAARRNTTTPASPYEINLGAIEDAMAGTQWDPSIRPAIIGPGNMEGMRGVATQLASNLANQNMGTIGPGNLEGMRPIATAAQSIKIREKVLNGLQQI